jgi:hypothetical protein
MKNISISLSIVLLAISCFGQIDDDLSYDKLETSAINAFRNNHLDSAIMRMESALQKFPEELGRSTHLLNEYLKWVIE